MCEWASCVIRRLFIQLCYCLYIQTVNTNTPDLSNQLQFCFLHFITVRWWTKTNHHQPHRRSVATQRRCVFEFADLRRDERVPVRLAGLRYIDVHLIGTLTQSIFFFYWHVFVDSIKTTLRWQSNNFLSTTTNKRKTEEKTRQRQSRFPFIIERRM